MKEIDRILRSQNIALKIHSFAVRAEVVILTLQSLILEVYLSFMEMELLWPVVPLP